MEPKSYANIRLLVIGSSGHASVLVDAIELAQVYRVSGYLDDTVARGTDRRGYPVLGGGDDAASICAEQRIECGGRSVIGENGWRRRSIPIWSRDIQISSFPSSTIRQR